MAKKANFYLGLVALTSLLSACGGGGSDSSSNQPSAPITNNSPTVEAGAAQSVDELTQVTLTGSANDSDGSIASYSWSQLSGTSVELSSPDSITATFTAPDVAADEVLTFQLTVADDDGATAQDTIEVKVINTALIQVSGTISYDNVEVSFSGHDYENVAVNPARGVSVNLLSSQGQIVASTQTDENGQYELLANESGEYLVEVVAELGGDNSSPNYVSVRDNFTSSDGNWQTTEVYRYTVMPPQVLSESVTNVNFHAELKWNNANGSYDQGRTAPVFALLDQAYDMHAFLESWSQEYEFEPLTIFWSENNVAVSGVWWNGEIPNSAFAGHGANILFVASDDEVNIDEYDRTIIAHELGHYILFNLARDESIGGSHSIESAMDIRQAFVEGFASYFSWLLTGSEYLIDSPGLINTLAESTHIFDNQNDDYDMGWFFQNVNSDVLKNVTTGNTEYALPEKGYRFVFDVISDNMKASDALISIHSFLGNSISRDNELTLPLENFSMSKGINSVSQWGEGESYRVPEHLTINALEHTYLPIYTEMELGIATQVCLNDVVFGSDNRLGVFSYLRLDLQEEGDYLLEWSSDAGIIGIDSQNHKGLRYISGGSFDQLHGSRLIEGVPAELNVISVYFYGNRFPGASEEAPNVSSGCIELTISKVQ